ncbi:histone-lysine N-methyltransferase SETMAR [Trichonephila clavipes]|nr:histone-lysine N-methyltransferase SETMAR [Trichonephila clavipes]
MAAEFKRGRKSLGGDERSGRPNNATTDENIAKVHQMVLDDRRIKVREAMNMSKERVCDILNQHLDSFGYSSFPPTVLVRQDDEEMTPGVRSLYREPCHEWQHMGL